MKLHIFIIVIVISFTASAQTTLPRVSDPIGFDMNSYQGRTWDMLYNTDWGKGGRNWNIQVPVSKPQGGLQINTSGNGEAYTGSHSKGFNKLSRTKHVSPREVNARLAADREWRMEQARQKREAEEMRRKMEDDQSEMRARMQHALVTAQFYADAAARDHWHATEGAKMLSEIKAKDFVRLPQRYETPGAELAAGIKPKDKGSITIVPDKIMKSNQSFNSDNSVVDIAGNGIMDEQQVNSWMKSFEMPDLANINMEQVKGGKGPKILVKCDELPLDYACLFTLPQYGLVAVWGDSLIVLKDKEFAAIAWMNNEQYSYVVPCRNKLIGKRESLLYVIDEKQSTILLELKTNKFSMFPHDDKSIFLLSWDDGVSTILNINLENRSYSEVIRLPCNIWTIVSDGKKIFALVENSVFMITENGFPVKMYTCEWGINDIAISQSGLLIATDEQVLYIKSKEDMGVFYKQGVQRLWTDNEGVYALDDSNNLLYFEN